jgi:nitroreductase
MKNKTFLAGAVLLAFCIVSASAEQDEKTALDVITLNFSASRYAAGEIPKDDIEKIVNAGIRSPSAMNRQPWKFTVVQTKALAEKIISGMPDGSVLVIVSSEGNADKNPKLYLDCALATENIYLAAQAAGFGSRIYTGPVGKINSSLKKELGISDGDTAISIVRIARLAAGVDALTSASPRKQAKGVVIYK